MTISQLTSTMLLIIKAQDQECNELIEECNELTCKRNKTKEEHYEFREEALKNVKSLLDHNENAKDKNAKLTRELKKCRMTKTN